MTTEHEGKTLGELIDRLYSSRQSRINLEKQVAEFKQQEVELREILLTRLHQIGLEKASGQLATIGVKKTEVPLVIEWDQIHEYIRVNDRFDLLQKRLSAPAWRDLYQSGTLVPGTVMGVDVDLSLTKSTRS